MNPNLNRRNALRQCCGIQTHVLIIGALEQDRPRQSLRSGCGLILLIALIINVYAQNLRESQQISAG